MPMTMINSYHNTKAHVRGRRSCLVKVDYAFSLVKSEI